MGCGKSWYGARLAEELQIPFIDTDLEIESQTGRSIAQIFQTSGENGFRLIERDIFQRILERRRPAVIATGGGLPCFFDQIGLMNKTGISVYLRTPVHLLVERLLPERGKRPLIARFNTEELTDFIQSKMTERAPCYEQALRIVDADEHFTPVQLLNSVVSLP